jgi:glucose-6-phosphate isomerase
MNKKPDGLRLEWRQGIGEETIGPRRGVSASEIDQLKQDLEGARREIDRERADQGEAIRRRGTDEPFDYGFWDLPQRMLTCWHDPDGEIQRIAPTADRLAQTADRHIVLGIGGSYLGAKALFDALADPYHNELARRARRGRPRIYFEGNNVDPAQLAATLRAAGASRGRFPSPFTVNVISKSGTTLETSVVYNIVRDALAAAQRAAGVSARDCLIATTGPTGVLRQAGTGPDGFADLFDVPDGVGGRYSVFSAVGLMPMAMFAPGGMRDIRRLLQGARDMTVRAEGDVWDDNPAYQYAALQHIAHTKKGCTIRVMCPWTRRLESLGFWYDQLCAESLGKKETGATPITMVATRELHSRGQQHQEGRRDKIITNIIIESEPNDIPAPAIRGDDKLSNLVRGKTLHALSLAAARGTNRAYREDARPTMDIVLPVLDPYTLGQLMQMLMIATVVEGKLLGVSPFGQPGVRRYKEGMLAELSGQGAGDR